MLGCGAALLVAGPHIAAPWIGGTAAIAQSAPGASGKKPRTAPANRTTFTDAEIIDGYLKVAFGAEYRLAGPSDRIRKYHKPVRILIEGESSPRRRSELLRIIADIAQRIGHLDIAATTTRTDANMIVTLVRDRDMRKTLTQKFGKQRARDIARRLDPQCLSGFRRNESFEIERAEVVLVTDAGDFTFRDCAYEEMLQALGPINDTDEVPWTMFNDDVRLGFFGVYDQHLLNIHYHPRIRAGMSVDEVMAILPDIMPEVRDFVTRQNGP